MPKAEAVLIGRSYKIAIYTTYQDRHLMRELPGAQFSRKDDFWLAPLSWATCVTLRGLFGRELEIGEKLMKWAWAGRERRIAPAMSLRGLLELPAGTEFPELDEVEKDTHLKLYPYQRVDLKFLLLNERSLLANPPGLGKTGVAIRFLQVLKQRGEEPLPAVIICPNSLKFATWQKEIQAWAPELKVQVVDGTAAKRRKQLATIADVYVINWDSIRLHSKLAPYGQVELTEAESAVKELNEMGHRTVILDEAHRLKDPRAKQTRAAWAVTHDARYRVAMTGTPVAKDIGDLWSLGHTIEPTWFPAKTRFMDRYAQVSLNFFGGAEVTGINPVHRDELFQIIDPLMRRVPKEAALPQLPPKLPVQYRHTPMSTKQQKVYDQMRDEMVAELNELLTAPNPFVKLIRLMQFASSMAEIVPIKRTKTYDRPVFTDEWREDVDGTKHPVPARGDDGQVLTEKYTVEIDDYEVKLINPSPKIDDMIDLLEEMGDEPLVVAAVSRQLIELASKKLTDLKISHGLVTGAQSPDERRQAIDAFQEGRTRVILLTLGAGAEGITLTRADTMLFMQESFSEVQNQQAQDRIYRIGSERHQSIRIIKQITPNSVEENKIELLQEKRGRMEEIVRDEAALKRLLGVK